MENVKQVVGRTYGQFCGLARALDVIGDRWNLLIVRELLPGPLRFGELRSSLPGVASNLLTERLRSMEAAGVVERRLGDVGAVYGLTPWGEELREPMEGLGRWGAPLLQRGQGDDAFRPRWLTLALPAMLRGRTAKPAVELGFEVEGLLIVLRIDEGGPSAKVDVDAPPDTVLRTEPDVVVGLAAGVLSADEALVSGDLQGSPAVVRLAFPKEQTAT